MRLSDHITVSVPLAAATSVPGWALSLRMDHAALLHRADGLDWARVRQVEVATLTDFAAASPYWRRARWRVGWPGFDMAELLDHTGDLRRRTVELVVAPTDPRLHDKLVVGDSLSLQMTLALAEPDDVDLAVLNELVSYVLLTGAQRPVRIEPITSLIKAAAGGPSYSLWDHSQERVHRDLWVHDDGRVGLSARLLQNHAYTTLAELGAFDPTRSAGYTALADYPERLFREQTECSFCQAYPLCGGWLRFADPTYDCEVWQLVLNGLAEAVGDAERQRALRRQPRGGLRT